MTPFQEQVQKVIDNPDQRFAKNMLAHQDGTVTIYCSFLYRSGRSVQFWCAIMVKELATLGGVNCVVKHYDDPPLDDKRCVAFTACIGPAEEEERTIEATEPAVLTPVEKFEVVAAKLAEARTRLERGEVEAAHTLFEKAKALDTEDICELPGYPALHAALTITGYAIDLALTERPVSDLDLFGLFNQGEKHCDDYIDDEAQPECLREYLRFQRSPATFKCLSREAMTTLFARTTAGVINLPVDTVVRVVMASRLGDVGITTHLDRQHGYDVRVAVAHLTDFSKENHPA